jgi:hypothetical protein
MRPDLSDLENDLRSLHAAGLNAKLLARLDASSEGTLTRLDPLETHLEHQLRASRPAPLPTHLQASLEAILATVPFPAASPNIVRFPGKNGAAASKHQRNWWPAAAAAVAILGAFAGWQLPSGGKPDPLAATGNPPAASTPPAVAASPRARAGTTPADSPALTPAAFRRGLSAASDEGVIWQNERQPHRVLKFVYRDHVTLKDAAGRTWQVEQPRVEYLIVPAKTD